MVVSRKVTLLLRGCHQEGDSVVLVVHTINNMFLPDCSHHIGKSEGAPSDFRNAEGLPSDFRRSERSPSHYFVAPVHI